MRSSQLLELSVPSDGIVELNKQMLGAQKGTFVAMLTGYESVAFKVDFSQPGRDLRLERRPTLEVTIKASGPGAGRTDTARAMISVRPPRP